MHRLKFFFLKMTGFFHAALPGTNLGCFAHAEDFPLNGTFLEKKMNFSLIKVCFARRVARLRLITLTTELKNAFLLQVWKNINQES